MRVILSVKNNKSTSIEILEPNWLTIDEENTIWFFVSNRSNSRDEIYFAIKLTEEQMNNLEELFNKNCLDLRNNKIMYFAIRRYHDGEQYVAPIIFIKDGEEVEYKDGRPVNK